MYATVNNSSRQRRALSGYLGDANNLAIGGVYTLRFESLSVHPSDSMLKGRLSSIAGLSVRRIDWTGGILGTSKFSNTVAITVVWNGTYRRSLAQLGGEMAASMSSGLFGNFLYSGGDVISEPGGVATQGSAATASQQQEGLPGNGGSPRPSESLPWAWIIGIPVGALVLYAVVTRVTG